VDDERELEVIRHDMERSRESLAQKLDALEHTLEDKVVGAREAVEHTVEAVEHTVEAVKETVSEAFDVRGHVRQHPWLMVGGAFSLGCLGGYLLGGRRQAEMTSRMESPTGAPALASHGAHAGNGHTEAPSRREEEESSPLAEEVKKIRGLAVGALMGLLREAITRALPPEWVPDVEGVVDDWTARLGGKPLRRFEHSGNQFPSSIVKGKASWRPERSRSGRAGGSSSRGVSRASGATSPITN